jgi:Peptidase family M1 domain
MLPNPRLSILALFLLEFSCIATLTAQHPGNANSSYQQLRTLLPGGEVIAVKNLELKRDAATFTFTSGDIAFYGQVNGKVTGAVFKGAGHFHLTPPTAEERHNLAIVSHSEQFDEDFDQVVLRFTDATAAELHKASAGAGQPGSEYASAAQEFHTFLRTKFKDNLDLRLLQDVLSPTQGGYFTAAIRGNKNHHIIFTFDPHGVEAFAPEEVSLMIWNDWGPSWPTVFQQASDTAQGAAGGHVRNAAFSIINEDLDLTIEKSGFLTGLATVHITAEQDGVAVAPFALFPTLRVSNVETDKAAPLDYVQEKKEEDADFGIVLAQPLKKGESATIKIAYGGKDVVKNEGNQNYYPVARESWYPNAAVGVGDYATYHMTFHVPKGLQLIATGTKVNDKTEGKITTTEWKTDVPLPVVGFNLGDFAVKEATLPGKMGDNLTIDAYANKNPPDALSRLGSDETPHSMDDLEGATMPTGKINTASMLPVQLSQGQIAARIYTDYFGPLPFAKVALTQQFACDYGQSWPMLVYLPICGFLDSTQQFALGVHPEDMYWKVVTAHEVAHQWWGQTVGFRSYRDQWMSEGFADTSASIFLQVTNTKDDKYREFWKEQRKLITEKNAMGFRPIDVGPVTMGFRLSTEKTGWNIYQNLVYPKGAYILHMIRIMMWSPRDGDQRFKDTMHDLVSTYRLQPATTEDFKAIVEKHMSPAMDIMSNHRMDWFFDEYVYGTDLPTYHFESQVTQNGDAQTLHVKLVQSIVRPEFKMVVPIYLELNDGRIVRWIMAVVVGNSTVDQTVPLPKTPSPVKRALINYNYDVLSTEN